MAAPAFVAASTATNDGGIDIAITIPASASVGDRLVLAVSSTTGSPTGAPSGWSLVEATTVPTDSTGWTFVYTAVATSGGDTDPSAITTVTFSGNSRASAAIIAYGVSEVLSSAIDESNSGGQVTVSTPTDSALGDARVVHIYGTIMNISKTSPDATVVSWTPHANTVERADIGTAAVNVGNGRQPTVMAADEEMLGGGTSTSRTATPSEEVKARSFVVLLGTTVAQPVADAGPDQNVAANALVNLNGTPSDGGGAGAPYTYQWTQTSGTTVTLSDATAEDPTFTAPATSGTLVFEFVVTDTAAVPSDPDTVTINVLGPEDTAVPDEDIDIVGWTPNTGVTAWEVLSDNTDATFVTSPGDPTSETFRVGLSTLTDPASTDTVTLSVRTRKVNASTGSITAQLIEGASTIRATLGSSSITGTGWNQKDYLFTPSEIDGVANWADVDVEVTVTAAT